ncbi:phospholipase A2 family protein [Methylobacterium sp. 77]|uniref:phospholipase A2 family protein n=1 Tax=Methylobacterium sp. 77 TaxID=1101192 RepID=UPI00036E408D|nr:phospholipase A2 family protein [Methylobacterium sp. 77]
MRQHFKASLALVAFFWASHAGAQATPPDSPPPSADQRPATEEPDDPVPGPPPPLAEQSDPNGRSGESLAEPGRDSGIPSSLRNSAQRAGGPANAFNRGGAAPETALPEAPLVDAITGKALFHGNYCGAGQRGEGLPPTDDLDAACMRHDACYEAAGHRSCACDAVLRREASAVSERPSVSVGVRKRALTVAQAADVMSCEAP